VIPLGVDESRKSDELLGEVDCWLLFLLEDEDEEGNPTNSQSTLSEAASLRRPPAGPLEKAYFERRRILLRKLFILNWAWPPMLPPETSVSHISAAQNLPGLC
jgi:hypothetical protein